MKIIEIADIVKNNHSLKRVFEGKLPELIKRLVDASSKSISYNRFPFDDAISTPGLDGIVKNDEKCEFVPYGDSYWEIGTSGLDKINEDYKKRTDNISEDVRKNTTFILIFPKYWHFRTLLIDWQKEKEKDWKEVLVYDAPILNSWLEKHIDVSLWFLKDMGVTQNLLQCKLVETAYNDLMNSTNPSLNAQIFCEDREECQNKLFEALKNKKIIYVKSESQFESVGFVLSAILNSNDEELIKNCLVIENKDSYNYVNSILKGKYLILNFKDTYDLKQESNRIILPCYKSNMTPNGIDLPVRGQRTMLRLLTAIGLDSQTSTDINYKSNGNLEIIRRLIPKNLVDSKPAWAKYDDIFYLIPLLILKNFDVKDKSHIKIAEYLTDLSGDAFMIKIANFIDIEDAPFRVVDNVYQSYNIEELWFNLKKFMVSGVFDKFCNIIEFIFSEKLPSDNFELTMDGLSNNNLDAMLKVLAFYAIESESNQENVDKFIKRLLNPESNNSYLIVKNLAMLAECSPRSVCEFLEEQVFKSTNLIEKLLDSYNYCYFESTINYLMCFNKYKFSAIKILFEISKIDKKYTYANTPKSDLIYALMPLINKNALTLDEKAEIITKAIDNDYTNIPLYFEIITQTSCCFGINYKVRKSDETDKEVKYGELYKFRNSLDCFVLEKILSAKDIENIIKFIEYYDYFNIEIFEKIAEFIKENKDITCDNDLYLIYKLTIEKLAAIKKFQKYDNWKHRKDYINVFTKIIEYAKPRDVFMQYKYMFESVGDFIDLDLDEEKLSWQEIDEKRKILRIDSLKKILMELGTDETIKTYVESVEDNRVWGILLAELFNDKYSLNLILDTCIKETKYFLISGFLDNFKNKDLVVEYFKCRIDGNIKKKIIPLLYSREYELLCECEEDFKLFYSNKSIGIHSEFDEELYNKFFVYNPIGLLDFFYNKVFSDSLYEQAINLLTRLKGYKEKIKTCHHLWELQEVFKKLEEYKYSEELAILELEFIEFFKDNGYPHVLVEYWIKNPNKFIQYYNLLCENKEMHNILYSLQYKLIFEKKQYDDVENFINFSKTIIAQNDDFLTSILGCVIGKTCVGADEIFPHESVRALIEENNDIINRHFKIGYVNSIGARIVGSGKSEYEIAEKLQKDAEKLAFKYPLTSKILIELSQFHKSTGRDDRKYDLLGI